MCGRPCRIRTVAPFATAHAFCASWNGPRSVDSLKGPSQPHLCFCLHARVWLFCFFFLFFFFLEHAEMNEITVKLLKIMKHTFRNTTYSKAIRFRFTMQYQ